MKRMVVASALSTQWHLDDVAQEIVDALDSNQKVYIESDAANDRLIGYSGHTYENSYHTYVDYEFETTAVIFPRYIHLDDYDSVETENYNNCLFVHVR